MSCSAKNTIVEILGDKLRKKGGDGEVATASICGEGKYVGLYFSAYRLPLCQKFTSELDTFYSRLRKERGDVLEIVFISSDENEDEFEHYYREMMHWLALPYKQRDRKKQLCRKFRVKMVPKLIILDSQTGEVVCENGREAVITDSEGITFPWKKKPFTEVIPGNFIDRQMKTVPMDSLKDKVLGIYFSAHWCRKFTPELVFTYNKIKEAGHSFEILFASLDRGEDSFKEYLNDMPWLAIPYGEDRIRELSQLFSVESIPMLVIVDPQGHVITTEGRSNVQKDPDGEDFPWYPPPCHEVDSYSVNVLQRGPCLVLFTEMEEDDGDECTTKALELMKPIAEEIIAAESEKGYEPACEFCVAGDDDMVERLQQYLSIADESRPLLVLTDLPMLRASHCEGKEITPGLIREFYKKFVSEELEWTTLS